MLTDNIHLKPTTVFHFDGLIVKVRLFVLMLFSIIVLLPSMSNADGLFDFQMKMAKKGNTEAEFKVGEMYETGFGVRKDMTEARIWTTKAAKNGHETAGFKLLYWDIERNGITSANKSEMDSLKTKASNGNSQAQYYLGKMHAHGVGLKKNTNKGLEWLNKATLAGVLEAEREIVAVREQQQGQAAAAKQRADEKKRADLKAKQEAQKKLQKQKQAEAKAKAKQNKATANARAKANKDVSDKAKLLAEQEAIANKKRHEAQKQALIKQREQEQKERKAQFESDPCSGKSARFLSTCK
jgi:TPR repeat protein